MKSHPFDAFSFVAGLVFTVLGLAGALGGLASLENLRVGWPLLLIILGIILVGSTIRDPRRADGPPPDLGSQAGDDTPRDVVDEVDDVIAG